MRIKTWILAAGLVAGASVGATAGQMEKSVEVDAPAAKVWSMIGPFCSIKDWHPAIGECTEKGKVRMLTTKDGKAHFTEKETASSKEKMMYTYMIEKSPLPVTGYKSTLQVMPAGEGKSTVKWTSTYTAAAGKEAMADEAIGGIYQAGLDNIQKMAK